MEHLLIVSIVVMSSSFAAECGVRERVADKQVAIVVAGQCRDLQ